MARILGPGESILTSAPVSTAITNVSLASWWILPNGTGNQVLYNGDTGGDGWGLIYFSGTISGFLGGVAIFGSPSSSPTDVWVHVAITNAGGVWTLYVDGVASGTSSSSAHAPTLNTGVSGGDQTAAEFTVWNVGLSAGEIAALSAGARTRSIRPLSQLLYWPLYGLSSPEPDLSGNGNNGILTGTSLADHAPVTLCKPGWGTYLAQAAAPSNSLFRRANLDGIGAGGPHFSNPLGG
jgi:Concanavalin A-like lectin/glucanases superfamily